MITEMFEQKIFLYIIIAICIVGLLVKMMLSIKYKSLIRASKKMGTSTNKLMRVLRLKFETCYKLRIGVNNVDTFVDKYVYRHRFCGLLLCTWDTISGELVILCALTGSFFSVLGLIYECGRTEILSTFIAGLLTCGMLISFDYLLGISTKRKILKVNIKDYLENFLKARLESDTFSSEVLEQYRKEYFELPRQQEASMTRAEKKKAHKAAKLQEKMTRKKEKNARKQPELTVGAEVSATIAQKPVKEKKKSLKPAEQRREAKKNELRKMIEEDKENRRQREHSEEAPIVAKSNIIPLHRDAVTKVGEKTGVATGIKTGVILNAEPKEIVDNNSKSKQNHNQSSNFIETKKNIQTTVADSKKLNDGISDKEFIEIKRVEDTKSNNMNTLKDFSEKVDKATKGRYHLAQPNAKGMVGYKAGFTVLQRKEIIRAEAKKRKELSKQSNVNINAFQVSSQEGHRKDSDSQRKEIAATRIIQNPSSSQIVQGKNENYRVNNKEDKFEISKEEAKVIEEILKEYLA